MYSVVLFLAINGGVEATASVDAVPSEETLTCFRLFRRRGGNGGDCNPCPSTCEPGCQPGGAMPEDLNPPETPLTAAEDKMLKAMKTRFSKDKRSAADTQAMEEYFRSQDAKGRSDYHKEVTAEEVQAAKMTPAEDKMLKEMKDRFTKDKRSAEDTKAMEEYFKAQDTKGRSAYHKEVTAPEEVNLNAPANILVRLPADAIVTFDGNATKSTSGVRLFQTAPITRGYFYEVQVTVERNGITVSTTRLVRVRPGQTTEVTFGMPVSQGTQAAQK